MGTDQQLVVPEVITPETLRQAVEIVRRRWPQSPHVVTFPGWAFADMMTLVAIIEKVASMME